MNFEIVEKPAIRKWVRKLTDREQQLIAGYCDIPHATLRRWAYDERSSFSRERQERVSKAMALWENGVLTKKVEYNRAIPHKLVIADKPRPIQRYIVRFGANGPKIEAAPRPKLPKQFPNPLLTTRK